MSSKIKRSAAVAADRQLANECSDDSSLPSSSRKGRRTVAAGTFKEAESDDEFASQHFCFPTKTGKIKFSGSNGQKKTKKNSEKHKKQRDESNIENKGTNSASSDIDSDCSEDETAEGPEYRIEFILGSKVCSPAQWREIGDGMNTYEVTRGSVWQQPDEEYFCDLHGQTADITKYLIKWQHASFIHCSWETEKDLMEMCHGSSTSSRSNGNGDDEVVVKNAQVANQMKKFFQRCAAREDLWEDLGATEWFLPSFTTVERILDVDDRENPVSVADMDWRHAKLPPRALSQEQEQEHASNQSSLTDEDETDLAALLMDGQSPVTAPVAVITATNEDGGDQQTEVEVDSMLTGDMFMSPGQAHEEERQCDGESTTTAPASALASASAAVASGPVALTTVFDEDSIAEDMDESGMGHGDGDGCDGWDDEKESDFLDVMEEDEAEDTEVTEFMELDVEVDEPAAAVEPPRRRSTREPNAPAVAAVEPTRQSTRLRHSSVKAQETAAAVADQQQVKSSETRVGKRTHKVKTTKTTTTCTGTVGSKSSSRKNRHLSSDEVYLHSNSCWLTVKWAGLTYSEVSQEDVNDLRNSFFVGEEAYTEPLRQFFRREQMSPVTKHPLRRQLQESTLTKTIAQIKALEQHTAQVALLAEEVGEGATHTNAAEAASGSAAGGADVDRLVLGGNLRDYQWEGVKWLLFNYSQRRNSILADEMGLGKTIQSAAFLQLLKSNFGLRGPFLVVAPLSTIVQWQREIGTWTDLDVVVYHGSQEDRQIIRDMEFRYVAGPKKERRDGFKVEVVVTTPETAVAFDVMSTTVGGGSASARPSSKRVLSQGIFWEMVIIDEAHKLKNSDSKLTTVLKDEYSYRNCLLLTGTPIQNNTEELFTLLNFVDKERFHDKARFMCEFGNISEVAQLSRLHDKLRPYILRREKDNVEKTVPPKEEVIIEVELTVVQKQYYRAIYEQNTAFLYKGQARDGPRLSNLAMELRKCCLHPFLIKGAQTELSKHYDSSNGEFTTLETLINTSGKLTLLDKLLPKLQADGHRVLIFSQFRMMLDLIEDYLYNKKCFTYDRIDGSITGRKRQAAIDRYMGRSRAQQEQAMELLPDGSPVPPPPEIFCMLLSTRAGGVGINLTAADTVILFDSDWNPQNDLQAQARAHRIGQKRFVKVYRLLTRGTYEMLMFKAASMKLGLDYAVMNGCNTSNSVAALTQAKSTEGDSTNSGGSGSSTSGRKRKGGESSGVAGVNALECLNIVKDGATSSATASSLSKKELEYLLKHGAYDMFKEERDGEAEASSKRFSEESIDDILQRSAMFSHADPDAAAEGRERSFRQGQGFSKASFVMNGNSAGCSGSGSDSGGAAEEGGTSSSTNANYDNIDINDEDFWQKVVGLASGLNDEEGEESDGHRTKQRRRNCRATRTDGFYKEPTTSIARLLQENDANADANAAGGGDSDSQRLLQWTDVQCNKLLHVLATNGGYACEPVPVSSIAAAAAAAAKTAETETAGSETVDGQANAAEQSTAVAVENMEQKEEGEEEEEQILEGWELIGHEFKVPRGVRPVPLAEIRDMSQKLVLQLLYNSFRSLLPTVGSGGCALAITQVAVNDKPQSQVQLASISSKLYGGGDCSHDGDSDNTTATLSEFEQAVIGHLRRYRAARTVLFDMLVAAECADSAGVGDISTRLSFNSEWNKLCIGGGNAGVEKGLAATLLRDDGYRVAPATTPDENAAQIAIDRDIVRKFVTLVESFELPASFTSAVALPSSVAASTSSADLTAVANAATAADAFPVQAVSSSINRWSRGHHHRLLLLEDLFELYMLRRFSGSDIIQDEVVRGVTTACSDSNSADGEVPAREEEVVRCLLQDLDDIQYYHLLGDSYSHKESSGAAKEKDGKDGVRRKKDMHCAAAVQTVQETSTGASARLDVRAVVRQIKEALSVVRGTLEHDKRVAEEQRLARERQVQEQLAAALLRDALKAEERAEKEALRAQEKADKEALKLKLAAEKAAAAAEKEAAREAAKEQKQAEMQAAQDLRNNRKYVLAVVKCMGRYGRPRGLYDYMRARHSIDSDSAAVTRQLDDCLISWEKFYHLVEKHTPDAPVVEPSIVAKAIDADASCSDDAAVQAEEVPTVNEERMAKLHRIVASVVELQSNPRSIYTTATPSAGMSETAEVIQTVFDADHPLYVVCNTTAGSASNKGGKEAAAVGGEGSSAPAPGSLPLSAVLPCVDGIAEKMDSMFRLRAVLLVFGSNAAVNHEVNAVNSNFITSSINNATDIAASIASSGSEAAAGAESSSTPSSSCSAPHLDLEVEWSDMCAFIRGMAKYCTGSGPTTPVYKRDTSLPAWWTVFHDFCLLRGLEAYGHKEYKQIAETDFHLTLLHVPSSSATGASGAGSELKMTASHALVVRLSRPHANFVLPAKEPGHEWVLDIATTGSVARVFDKRVTALTKALFAAAPCQGYLHDFTRETSTGATATGAMYAGLPPLSPMFAVAVSKTDKKGKAPVNRLSFGTSTSSASSSSNGSGGGMPSSSFAKFFNRSAEPHVASTNDSNGNISVAASASAVVPTSAVTKMASPAAAAEVPSGQQSVAETMVVVDLAEEESASAVTEREVPEVIVVEAIAIAETPVKKPEEPVVAMELTAAAAAAAAPVATEHVPMPPTVFPKTPSKPLGVDPQQAVAVSEISDSPAGIDAGINSAVKSWHPANPPVIAKKRAVTPSAGSTMSKKQKLAAVGAKQTTSFLSFFKKPEAAPAVAPINPVV